MRRSGGVEDTTAEEINISHAVTGRFHTTHILMPEYAWRCMAQAMQRS